jgi:hypothetical protein
VETDSLLDLFWAMSLIVTLARGLCNRMTDGEDAVSGCCILRRMNCAERSIPQSLQR